MRNDAYTAAGVDVNAGYESVRLMKSHVERTRIPGVPEGIGGFGGLFIPDLKGMEEPVFVSGTDGVGTKLKLAQILGRHDTVGIDLVAMCANDIICCGAKPLFFLDYISCDKNIPEKVASIVNGIADGCVAAGCALIGGETAEHPGTMQEGDYDLAGFCVGVVDRPKLVKATSQPGDVIIGLKSSGVHSNGFSLVRKVFGIGESGQEQEKILNEKVPCLDRSLGEELLTPTAIYVKPILTLLEQMTVKGIAHITGGGFYENIPRCLPDGLAAEIVKDFYKVPPIFGHIAEQGGISENDMYGTFNMGIGMVTVVGFEDAGRAIEILARNGIESYCIGKVVQMQSPESPRVAVV
ncbi:MAG: phosphoribosylformylglycinamidine cyclo-ligase [Oscillospiraceae bacterium]|nr:phosphoribosylformylglycinamidine cyclo-ligase [Oscillospiraceae bacterium]